MTRPSETLTATIGTIIAAVVGILAAYGVDIPAGAVAGIIVVVSWIAAAVTWYVARQQRSGVKSSLADGKVAQ